MADRTKALLVLIGTLAAGAVLLLTVREGTSELEWREAEGHRWAPLEVSGTERPGFERLSPDETGVRFRNEVTEEQYLENSHYLNGSGVALGDVDGDGLTDVYFAAMDGPNALYRNLGGFRFEEITQAAGVAAPGRFSTGAVFADVDGDDDLDLLVTSLGGPISLFLNDGTGRFRDATAEAGLASGMGSMSMALADVDGDGDLDLYVGNNKVATVRDLMPPEARSTDRVVRERGGEYEIAPEFREDFELGRVRGDVLPVQETAEPDLFYLNEGDGRFRQVPFTSGAFLDEEGRPLGEAPKDWALSVRFQDLDGDGDPDLYVCNDFQSPDHIWLNDGTGRFRALRSLALRQTSTASMGIDFSDVDRDGDPDFLVVEMLALDHARRMAQTRGSAPDPPRIGLEAERIQTPRNTLQLARGDGTYAEAARLAGLEASEWSWFGVFLDVDLDGWEDVLVGNGHFYDGMDQDAILRVARSEVDWRRTLTLYPPLRLRNLAFRNRGDGTFEEVGREWGFSDEEDVSHGFASGDLDNDGDLDVVLNRLGSPAAVFRNRTTAPRIAVRLAGRPPNTRGIGAKIRVEGGPVPQSKEVFAGGHYLSGADPVFTFAAGDGDRELTIRVTWRSGARSRVDGVRANRIYEIREPARGTGGPTAGAGPGAGARPRDGPTDGDGPTDETGPSRGSDVGSDGGSGNAEPTGDVPLFEDATDRLGHRHHEEPYEDFRRQPLLPRRMSQMGPGVAWYDADGDGDEDLAVGAGRGGRPAFFRNEGEGRWVAAPLPARVDADLTGLAVWTDGGGDRVLLAGVSSWEAGPDARTSVRAYRDGARRPRGEDLLPPLPGPTPSSPGPLATADYDGDGDLDLFVGGRAVPGRYPVSASSRLYRNGAEGLAVDYAASAALEGIGLVSGAVFTDLDADGDPDLVLATEWGPIRVLENEGGRFSDATARRGLVAHTGWWNGIAAGDLDGDGRMDLVATNWGLNTLHGASPERPALAYHGDFDNDGTWDVLEARHEPGIGAPAPIRPLLSVAPALPFLRGVVRGFRDYGTLSVEELLGGRLRAAGRAEATTLATTAFLNRGDRFEPVRLPPEAQLAPAFGVTIADVDGDGHEDVFLSQNFFGTRQRIHRNDAGRGLWLRGDGTGRLTPLPGRTGGVRVYGEARGAAVADYDEDGRVDLVVAQNGAPTRLFRNVGARPGLRVRLAGRPGNPDAVGAVLRVDYGERLGPAREVHGGSGYWSRDGAVQVMGLADPPRGLRIRWPDGRASRIAVEAGAREVTVRHPDLPARP